MRYNSIISAGLIMTTVLTIVLIVFGVRGTPLPAWLVVWWFAAAGLTLLALFKSS